MENVVSTSFLTLGTKVGLGILPIEDHCGLHLPPSKRRKRKSRKLKVFIVTFTMVSGCFWISCSSRWRWARFLHSFPHYASEKAVCIVFLGNLPASFPSQYPSSCLLGCVEVVDCLAQEQYQELYPGGESESPYVWICENPRELSMLFPIRGQHKICKYCRFAVG